jgi:sugar lactone lactonase YvrE
MRLYPLSKVVFPCLVIAAVCLQPIANTAQESHAIRVDTRTGSALQGHVADPSASAIAQRPVGAITLDPPTGLDLQADTVRSNGETLPPEPANFRRLGEATVGQAADLHTLTLRFNQTTRITGISISNDFKIEQGGSCVEGNTYQKGTTCRMLVRFTPQGPGNRTGKLTIGNTASATPDAFGIGGYGYSPVLSFIPSDITTVPGTYPSKAGLLNGAQYLTVDGGDTLWVADTGNGIVRQIDSSGTIKTLASGYTGASGIAVDTFGQAYFDVPSTGKMYEIYDYGPVVPLSGTGTASCPAATPCTLSSEALDTPGEMSMDPYNHLFFTDSHSGAAFSTVQPTPANLIFLYDPFPYQTSPSSAMAVDSGDNLYSMWSNGGACEIVQQSLYNAENTIVNFNKIAGGHTCGFAGDGGLAGNAEISAKIGQIAFDAAGDLYFTDTNNQRVRRIDYTTGIIRTIAGTGAAGYGADNIGALRSALDNPTGVGVDSQGQVYIISGTTVSTAQVIRKVTAIGVLTYSNTVKGTSFLLPVVITNTGNSTEILTNWALTGPDPGDFSVDPTTTSCLLTPGSQLASGQTCQIGFKFTPQTTGWRSADFVMLNNTSLNSNTIELFGTGVLQSATFKITSPSGGSNWTSGTAVPFSVTVTSTSSPAPTGTVQFKVDGANYGGPVTVSSGGASTSVTGLTQTSHTLSATYSGDSNYAPGGPVSVTINVTAVAAFTPQVSLTPLLRAAASCQSSAYWATVTTPSGIPTGSVQLLNGNTVLTTNRLGNGRALLIVPSLPPGKYSFTARYSGDSQNQPAVSTPLRQYVSSPRACSQLGRGSELPDRAGMQ